MRFYYYYDPYKRYMKEKPKIYRDFEKKKREEKAERLRESLEKLEK